MAPLRVQLLLVLAATTLTAATGAATARPRPPPPPPPALQFSSGFANFSVLQRGDAGVRVYGFATTADAVAVTVSGTAGNGSAGPTSYSVAAEVAPWEDTTGCDSTSCPYPMPAHGAFVWWAALRPQPTAGGNFSIVVRNALGSASISSVTWGDVWFCSGQSNMALETYFTFSIEDLRAEIEAGQYSGLRTFQLGFMSHRFEAPGPQWVTTWDDTNTWHRVVDSSRLPLGQRGGAMSHSPWARFSATCMYFGAELINARRRVGLDADVPIGLLQSAIGGTQIEAWMDNSSRALCANLSTSADGSLFRGMVAPFANYSVAGWVWYQGENNCHGTMGNVLDGTGYGCALPAMVRSWRSVFRPAASGPDRRLFGVATLAAGGSEGAGQNMAGMRWSQTANFGRWADNPALPNAFGAQVYDLGDPWAHAGDGNQRVLNMTACDLGECRPALDPEGRETLDCCWPKLTNCTDATGKAMKPCPDMHNCSLPEPHTGLYGTECRPWNASAWLPLMRGVAKAVRANSPSGIPASNFMGSIHPRIKRPVGRRLAQAAARLLLLHDRHDQQQQHGLGGAGRAAEVRPAHPVGRPAAGAGAFTGPTIAGCSYAAGRLVLKFNATLLDGEGLLLQPFDANATGGWSANPYNDSDAKYYPYRPPLYQPTYDSLGTMVCTAEAGGGAVGNVSTCACQGFDWVTRNLTNTTTGHVSLETVWFCQDGPGWKPDAEDFLSRGKNWPRGGSAPSANLYRDQWRPAALVPVSPSVSVDPGSGEATADVAVDLSSAALRGRTPLAVRLAWPLFGNFKDAGPADTCCPNRAIQDGHGVCIAGSCPLYSAASELPANPFFAVISAGRCHCKAPQTCDA